MQYLLNWRLFLLDRCPRFPNQLCFPQFFYMAIYSIIHHYYKHEPTHLIFKPIEEFYNALEIIVNIIFPGNVNINLIPPKEIEILIRDTVKKLKESTQEEKMSLEIFYLETFMSDEADKINYQDALLKQSLNYYEKANVHDIIWYISEKNCCNKSVSLDLSLPPSKHYVTINTNNNFKEELGPFGPHVWGPFYWKIFHAIAEGCTSNDRVLEVVDNYPQILPAIIPCDFCRVNFYLNIKPSTLQVIQSKNQAISLYWQVHSDVTKHK